MPSSSKDKKKEKKSSSSKEKKSSSKTSSKKEDKSVSRNSSAADLGAGGVPDMASVIRAYEQGRAAERADRQLQSAMVEPQFNSTVPQGPPQFGSTAPPVYAAHHPVAAQDGLENSQRVVNGRNTTPLHASTAERFVDEAAAQKSSSSSRQAASSTRAHVRDEDNDEEEDRYRAASMAARRATHHADHRRRGVPNREHVVVHEPVVHHVREHAEAPPAYEEHFVAYEDRRARPPPYCWETSHQSAVMMPPPPPGASFGAAAPLYTHFSETCGAPLTRDAAEDARKAGHEVVPLVDAYGERLAKLRQLMMAKLLPRRDRLAAAARWVSERHGALDRVYDKLDSETRRDADEVLHRLKDVHAAKTSELRRAADYLRADVDEIDRLSLEISNNNAAAQDDAPAFVVEKNRRGVAEAPAPASAKTDGLAQSTLVSMVGFVHRFPELCHDVETLAAKPTPHLGFDLAATREGGAAPDPEALMPRELEDRLEAVAACRAWAEAVDLKDEMLWEVTDRLKALDAALVAEKELTEEYAAEIAHWVQLARELQNELDKTRADNDRKHASTRDLDALLSERDLLNDENAAQRRQIRALRDQVARLKGE